MTSFFDQLANLGPISITWMLVTPCTKILKIRRQRDCQKKTYFHVAVYVLLNLDSVCNELARMSILLGDQVVDDLAIASQENSQLYAERLQC